MQMRLPEPKGSFVRWQSITISQLSYAVNLVLALATTTLGFQITLLLNDKFIPIAWQKCVFSISLLLLAISVVVGIFVVVNRLRDFRATKEAARLREDGASETTIEPYRLLYRKLGARTWMLFWWQLGAFGAGVVLVTLAVLASVGHKLL
jgi:hypothetical protein